MRKALPLVLAGALALGLGVLGSYALASSLSSSSAEAAKTAEDVQSVPGVYGTR